MMIWRCAWHVQYYGRPRLDGVASWRGFHVRFTDGICRRCQQRFRAEHEASLKRRQAAVAAPALTDREVA